MVAQEQITKLKVKYQTSELNVVKEYLQHLFLSYFYQLPQSAGIYFKGGTALRFVYQSPRFSEDLDFASNKENISGIEDILLEVLGKLEKENIKAALGEAKKTSGGYLATLDFELLGQLVSIKIEISFRERENRGETVTIASDFIPAYNLVTLAKDQLVSGKLLALVSRQKPRDFYDLYFMLRAGLISPGQRNSLKKIKDLLKKLKINFALDLRQFLPKSHWAIIKDFKTTLKKELERFI